MRLIAAITMFGSIPGICLSGAAMAADGPAGVITKLSGTVTLFSHPSASIEGPSPRALFEGVYYSVRPARVGDRIESGSMLRTALDGKARVILPNGDHYQLAPGTAYRGKFGEGGAQEEINVLHGTVRGVVAKRAARRTLIIRTRAATMGVRGTDFTVFHDPVLGTKLAVIRGAVEMKPEGVAKAEPVAVKGGEAAEVYRAEAPVASRAADPASPGSDASGQAQSARQEQRLERPLLRKLAQEEVSEILSVSRIEASADRAAAAAAEESERIQSLEAKAREATLIDIRADDPKLFARLQARQDSISDVELSELSARKVIETAPRLREVVQPERDAYRRYLDRR
jgi:hypothetical protein